MSKQASVIIHNNSDWRTYFDRLATGLLSNFDIFNLTPLLLSLRLSEPSINQYFIVSKVRRD